MNSNIGQQLDLGKMSSPTHPLQFFLKGLSDAREEHDEKISIGGRTITNLRFADDIDAFAEEKSRI